MNLVLVGRHSLDELQNLAVENFSGIEDKNLVQPDFSEEVCFDKEHSFGKVFKVIPSKNLKTLQLNWVMPSTPSFNSKRSDRYLSHIFGYEGPNSLLSELVKLSMATGLSAGYSRQVHDNLDRLTISLVLTEKGEQNWKDVMEVVYMFINKIRSQTPRQYIYDEIKNKSLIDFDNLTKS